MRELTINESKLVSGGDFEFNGCDPIGLSDLGGIAGGAGAIGTTTGALATSSSVVAGQGAVLGATAATVFAAGYNVGVGINHVIGQCGGGAPGATNPPPGGPKTQEKSSD